MKRKITTGLTSNGLPYGRIDGNGGGERDLVVLNAGPDFAHAAMKPIAVNMALGALQPLLETHTLHLLSRRRGMSKGSTVDDISNDAADWIRAANLRTPVDLVGVSSGGSYALPLAANHSDLVRSLTLIETADRLSDEGKSVIRTFGDAITAGRPRHAYKELMHPVYGNGIKGRLMGWIAWIFAPSFTGKDPDIEGGWIEIEAEEALDFRTRLEEIQCPAVVMGADGDPFYPVEFFKETAEGLPHGRYIHFGDVGHTLHEHPRRLAKELRTFLDHAI